MKLTFMLFIMILLFFAVIYLIVKILTSKPMPLIDVSEETELEKEDDCETVAAIMAAVYSMYQKETGRTPKLSFKIKRRV